MTLPSSTDVGMDSARLERVRQMVLDYNRTGGADGAHLLVARHGQMVLEVVDGWADRKMQREMTANAVFAALSITKQFTAVMSLILVERGLLQLHQPIAELLPYFRVPGKEKINLYHLLTQTSGVVSKYPPLTHEEMGSIETLSVHAARAPLESLPGERVNYSVVVAHSVIAALCLAADGGKRSFSQMLDEEIFRPLRMNDTSLTTRSDLVERFCPIRTNFEDDIILSPKLFKDIEDLILMPGGEVPGGGAMTTAPDLFRFAEMLRRGGELDRARILAPSTLNFATRVHTGDMRNVIHDATIAFKNWTQWPANLGLGFYMRGEGVSPGPLGVLLSPRTFAGVGGRSALFAVDPEYDLTVVFLSTGELSSPEGYERFSKLTNMIVSSAID